MEDAFPMIVVIGLAIFGMIWVGTQADTNFDFDFSDETPDSMMIHSEDPGTIGASQEDFRTEDFGSFTVGELRGQVQAYTSEKETVKDSLLGGEKIEIEYNATQPGDGQITFEVLGTEGQGEIWVKVNGNWIYSAATVADATPEITIGQDNFKPGMNKIEIGTSRPGLLGSSTYAIEDIKVSVEDRKFHDYTDYFEVFKHELDGVRPSNLTFQIPLDSSIPEEPLKIEVNNKEVFSRAVGRSTQQVVITPQNSDLSTGYNTIKFSTSGDSKYRIENAELPVRYSIKVREPKKTMEFDLDQETLDYTERGNTWEELRFEYRRKADTAPVQVILNGAIHTVEPGNGFKTVQINEGTLQKENTLTIKSNQTFTAKNLQITSEKER